MNIIYHPMEFVGYELNNEQFKYAHLMQKVEYVAAEEDVDPIHLKLFGFEKPEQHRHLLYQVPSNHTDFQLLIEKYPNARILRAISHEVILTSTEMIMMSKGLLKLDFYIQKQLVRYGDSVFLDKTGLPVYAQNKLSLSGKFGDQDYREDLSPTDIAYGHGDLILAFAGSKY